MTFKIKSSHIIAVLITGGIGAWMLGGELQIGGQSGAASESVTIAERQTGEDQKLFRVNYIPLHQEERLRAVPVRGRTQADAIITVRAETGGIVEKRLVEKGDMVKSGDLVCVIERGAREANLARAEAQLAQSEGEYIANEKLSKKGFASKTKLRQMKYALDSAKAELAQSELELERTEVRANASGTVQDPIAEVGDVLAAGDTCVTLVDAEPMLFVGQVSERAIADVTIGMDAEVSIVSNQTVEGKVRYIAPSADAQTRTFLVEIELSSSKNPIRDGLTASAKIKLPPKSAFRVSPSWLSLADSGEVGLKTISSDDIVGFEPVTILAQTKDGFWVDGPKQGTRIITLGQEYVITGERVEPVLDTFVKAEANQ